VEASFFGHRRGAFTGAVADEPGFVRSADCGTLFLDEIADLPLPAQTALLRVLQESEVSPVGSTQPERVDVRVVAATHADLEARTREGQFREDLLARLTGFTFHLPPLCERREDLGLLLAALLDRIAPPTRWKLSVDAGRAVALYDWPRNVRELQQVLASATVLATPGDVVELTHLPPHVAGMAKPRGTPPTEAPAGDGGEQALRRALVTALSEHRGDISQVASSMGKARMQIQRWIRRFRIDAESFRR
jgi:DNA-binding NtrC family response regulator